MSPWISVLTGTFSLIGAFGGVALLWFLQGRTRKEDREHRQLELRREAALQIYEELDALAAQNSRLLVSSMELLKDEPKPAEGGTGISLGKLRGLLAIYFPGNGDLFATIRISISTAISCVKHSSPIP